MVRVNRNQLPDKEALLLLRQFDSTLGTLTHSGTTVFLNELLGKEERLTIAKRFAAIVLIHQGFSEYKTSQLLKLSYSTTRIIANKLESGAYNGIIKQLKRKKVDYIKLLDTIDSILHLGGVLPHRIGLDRYRNLDRVLNP